MILDHLLFFLRVIFIVNKIILFPIKIIKNLFVVAKFLYIFFYKNKKKIKFDIKLTFFIPSSN